MKRKLFYVVIFVMLLFVLGFVLFGGRGKNAIEESKCSPRVVLNGKEVIHLNLGSEYKEEGFKASCGNKDISKKVKITSNVNVNEAGNYELNYIVSYNGIKAITKRYVKITGKPFYKDSYDNIDNTMHGWWSGNKKDHTRPAGGADINELKKYNAYFMGPNEKVLYLTFDEGGNDTYVKEIVDVLNNNDVKATFFLCGQYILDNKDLIKKIADTGHSVGNHTDNHYSMPSLATRENFNKYLAEVQMIEDSYRDITGKELDKVYRDPRGEWSFRDLQIMKDMGYKSFFYSADYMDFGGNVSKEYALNELMKRYHNGAIYLMHPKNKGNYEALDTFIKEMKKLGYRFDLVKNIG